MCDTTNKKSHGAEITVFNEVRKNIVYILDNTVFLLPMVLQHCDSWLSGTAAK